MFGYLSRSSYAIDGACHAAGKPSSDEQDAFLDARTL